MDIANTARLLVIGDLHFSDRSAPLLQQLSDKIIQTVERTSPDAVVFLGDTLDRFATINSVRHSEATDLLYVCSLLSKVILLIGNHDIPRKTHFLSTHHGFNPMRYWNNTIVVDRQCVEFVVNGLTFQAVPYCPNGRLQDALDTLPSRSAKPTATFCHQEIKGHALSHLTGDDGDGWPSGRGLLVCGHIHLHHYMPATQERDEVLYVGTPYQDNYSENTDKSISLLTFSDSGWTEERIYLDLPKKVRLEMTALEYSMWSLESNTIYSLTVTGTHRENSAHRESDKTLEIRRSGGSVMFLNADDRVDATEMSGDRVAQPFKTVRDSIAESIVDKPHLQRVFAQIYIV